MSGFCIRIRRFGVQVLCLGLEFMCKFMFKFKFKGLENPHPRTTFVAFKLIIREKDVCGCDCSECSELIECD